MNKTVLVNAAKQNLVAFFMLVRTAASLTASKAILLTTEASWEVESTDNL